MSLLSPRQGRTLQPEKLPAVSFLQQQEAAEKRNCSMTALSEPPLGRAMLSSPGGKGGKQLAPRAVKGHVMSILQGFLPSTRVLPLLPFPSPSPPPSLSLLYFFSFF